METKSFKGEFKATADGEPGTFEAIVSVFGNVDDYGDRMVKGAFARTLEEKGLPPIVWSHEWQVPPIGSVAEATETDEGLLIKGRLFIAPDEDHAVARQVYTAMKAGALKEFSFGYSTKASNEVTEDGEAVREITDVDLYEVGPTLVGANSETRLIGVKTLERAVAASLAEAPKNFSGGESDAEKKDSPQDKEPAKPSADAVDEESATRIAAVLLARPNINIQEADHGSHNEA